MVDPSISALWDRVNLAMILHCLPSEIDDEANRDMEAIMVILATRNEKAERDKEMEETKWS